jgi:hypothetical protein
MDASRPDDLDRLEELGIVSYEWYGDDNAGDWYPVFRRRHTALVERAHQKRSTLRVLAQCTACSEKWNLDIRKSEECQECFFGRESIVLWCWNWPLPRKEVA